MKYRHTQQSGFVLLLTLLVLSMSVLLVTQLFHKGTVHIHFDQTMIEREKAKELALSGLELALSQLSVSITSTGKPTEKQKKEGLQELAKEIIPSLNRWQTFELDEKKEGIKGKIQLSISCENGKLNLNQLFDFQNKKFKGEGQKEGDMKKNLQEFFASMKKFAQDKSLFEGFEKFLKARQYKLNDVTELITIPEFQTVFAHTLFYVPPEKGHPDQAKRPIYLTDLFTLWTNTPMLQPLVLSDSILAVLGIKRAEAGDIQKRKNQIAQILKQLETGQKGLAQYWDAVAQPLYGKEFKGLPKNIDSFMTASFDPTVFSVLSYGTIGQITQKIFAIIKKRLRVDDSREEFIVKKLYWL